ncbi:unnamed protein product [Parajaminaea phylloscopi]
MGFAAQSSLATTSMYAAAAAAAGRHESRQGSCDASHAWRRDYEASSHTGRSLPPYTNGARIIPSTPASVPDGPSIRSNIGGPQSSVVLRDIPSVRTGLATYSAAKRRANPAFRLCIRQHPAHGLALGDDTALKAARPPALDPPLVCELLPEHRDDEVFLSIPELSLRVVLVGADKPGMEIKRTPRGNPALTGDCDQTAFVAQVFPPKEQSLFIFADTSCRIPGLYRLRIDVIDRTDRHICVLGSIFSDVFEVHDRRTFPGLSPSTELIQAIVRRGLKLRVVKPPSNRKYVSSVPQGKKRRVDGHWPLMHSDASRSYDDEDAFDALDSSPASSQRYQPTAMPPPATTERSFWAAPPAPHQPLMREPADSHHAFRPTPTQSDSAPRSLVRERPPPDEKHQGISEAPMASAIQKRLAPLRTGGSRFAALLAIKRGREAETEPEDTQSTRAAEDVLPLPPVLNHFVDESVLRNERLTESESRKEHPALGPARLTQGFGPSKFRALLNPVAVPALPDGSESGSHSQASSPLVGTQASPASEAFRSLPFSRPQSGSPLMSRYQDRPPLSHTTSYDGTSTAWPGKMTMPRDVSAMRSTPVACSSGEDDRGNRLPHKGTAADLQAVGSSSWRSDAAYGHMSGRSSSTKAESQSPAFSDLSAWDPPSYARKPALSDGLSRIDVQDQRTKLPPIQHIFEVADGRRNESAGAPAFTSTPPRHLSDYSHSSSFYAPPRGPRPE